MHRACIDVIIFIAMKKVTNGMATYEGGEDAYFKCILLLEIIRLLKQQDTFRPLLLSGHH